MTPYSATLRFVLLCSGLISPMTLNASNNGDENTFIKTLLQQTLSSICQQHTLSLPLIKTEDIVSRDRTIGVKSTYKANNGDQLLVEQIKPSDKVLSYRLTYIKNGQQPLFFIATDQQCSIKIARKVIVKNETAVMLHILDTDLSTVISQEAIKPDVPKGANFEGVRVGLIDSGINYLLPQLAHHLARDSKGNMIGYDFWDMDSKPFDYNPSRSIFFPQRHGTKTATVLINEAPNVSLVPYRYPRHHMHRMKDLIHHAAANNVSIMAMPLGSHNKQEWLSFYEAAKEHPNILFIVSAGNNGFNIDIKPVYPASFELDNLLVVSSSSERPMPATRTNWGLYSVDILVPAEQLKSVNFEGKATRVSGTSYAVSRIAALAARLKLKTPNQTGLQLKNKILSLSDPSRASQFSTQGLLADPLVDTARINITHEPYSISPKPKEQNLQSLNVNIVLLENSGWTVKQAKTAANLANKIYKTCGIYLDFTLNQVNVNDYLLNLHSLTSRTLIEKLSLTTPVIFLVKDTQREEPFEAEAFGVINTKRLPWLKNTAWLVSYIKDPGIAMAHELVHILVDNGDHSDQKGNLMNDMTSPNNTHISKSQCQEIKQSLLFNNSIF